MTMYPRIKVLQPQPFDLVDQRVQIAGVGSGFEATIGLRVRDGNSRQLARTFVNAGGTGVLGNFQAAVELPGVPATARGLRRGVRRRRRRRAGQHGRGAGGLRRAPGAAGTTGSPCTPSSPATPSRASPRRPTATPASTSASSPPTATSCSDPNLIFPGQQLRVPARQPDLSVPGVDPRTFCAQSRAGRRGRKGGVGKTTVTAAMARMAAGLGLSVLIVEVEGKSGLAARLRRRGPRSTTSGSWRPGIRARSLTPDVALVEYLEEHGLRRISKRLVKSRPGRGGVHRRPRHQGHPRPGQGQAARAGRRGRPDPARRPGRRPRRHAS